MGEWQQHNIFSGRARDKLAGDLSLVPILALPESLHRLGFGVRGEPRKRFVAERDHVVAAGPLLDEKLGDERPESFLDGA